MTLVPETATKTPSPAPVRQVTGPAVPTSPPPIPQSDPQAADDAFRRVSLAREFVDPVQERTLRTRAEETGLPLEVVRMAGGDLQGRFQDARDRTVLDGAHTLRNWIADPTKAAIASDDVSDLGRIEMGLRSSQQGWFGDMYGAAGLGVDNLQASYYHLSALFGGDLDAAADGISRQARQMRDETAVRGFGTAHYMQRLEAASGLGKVWAAVSDPLHFPALLLENLAFSLPGKAGGFVGGMATPVPGGAVLGFTAGGVLSEMGAWMHQEIGAAGYDLTDPAQIKAAYQDVELIDKLKYQALRKGLGTTALDALSLFFAGRTVAKVAAGKGTAGAYIRASVREGGEQAAFSMAGEGTGQGLAYLDISKIDWDEVVLEGIADTGQSAIQIAGGAALRSTAPHRKQAESAGRAVQDTAAVLKAVEGLKTSKVASEAKGEAVKFVERAISESDPEMANAHVPRETWDALAKAEGRDPREMAEEIATGIGGQAYDAAKQSGQMTLPTADLLVALKDSPKAQEILENFRYRPDSISLADARALDERAAQIEEDARKAATFFQDDVDLDNRGKEIDAELAAREGRPPTTAEELAKALGDDIQVAADLIREAASEGQANEETLAAILPAGTALDPVLAGQILKDVAADPEAFAKALEAPSAGALKAERKAIQERQDERQAKVDARAVTANEIAQRASQELEAAGRKKPEAELLGSFLARAFEVLADRTGLDIADLAERYRVTFSKGSAVGKVDESGKPVKAKGKKGGTTPTRSAAGIAFDVQFFERANRSTFFHETGHVFLEILADISQITGEGSQHASDFAEVLDWFGVQSREEITTKHHEQFARGFEAYIRTGEAPSSAMRRAFATFRSWLMRIYLDARRLKVDLPPQIKRVMDRIVATDAEIAAAEYEAGVADVLDESVLASMSEEDRAAYVAKVEDARNEARERLDRARSKDARRRFKDRPAIMDRLRAEIRQKVMRDPAMVAMLNMSRGENPDGTPTTRILLAPSSRDGIPAKRIAALDKMGVFAENEADGFLPDDAAGAFGFESGDQLLNAILAVRAGPERLVERFARRRFQQDFPELLNRAEIKSLSRRAVQGEARAELLEATEKHYRKLLRENLPAAVERAARGIERGLRRSAFERTETIADIRARASRILSRLRYRDISPMAYMNAARAARSQSQEAARTGKFQVAADATNRLRMNLELYRIASSMKARSERVANRLKFFNGQSVREILVRAGEIVRANDEEGGDSYLDQMQRILSRFEFRRQTLKEADRKETLAEFAEARRAEGVPLDIPQFVLDEANRSDWRNLTLAQLEDVLKVAEGIYATAKLKDRVRREGRSLKTQNTVAATVKNIEASRGKRNVSFGEDTPLERFKGWWEGWISEGTRASIYARMMDRGADDGAVFDGIIRPINEATDNDEIAQRILADQVTQLYTDQYTEDEMRDMDRQVDYAGTALSHDDRLSWLGLFGNPEGRRQIGKDFTQDQIAAILASFSQKDIDFVRARWTLFDAKFAEDAKINERLTGQRTKLVDRLPFSVPLKDGDVRLEGGYHPLTYQGTARGIKEIVLGGKISMDIAPASLLPSSFRKERVQKVVDRHLYVGRSAWMRHLQGLQHTISFREAVIQVQSVMRHNDFRKAVEERYGIKVMVSLNGWLARVAGDHGTPSTAMDTALANMRRRVVVSRLALRASVALKQLSGLRMTVVRVGGHWTWQAAREYAKHPQEIGEWIAAQSKFMAARPLGTRYREMNEARAGKLKKWEERGTEIGMWGIIHAQLQADRVTWLAQYKKSMSKMPSGLDEAGLAKFEADVVAQADQAVKDSQAGGQTVDLSLWESGGPFMRILTTFGTEMSLRFNATRDVIAGLGQNRYSVMSALGQLSMIYTLEATVAALVTLSLAGDDDEDDEDRLANAAERMVREIAGSALDTMPLVRMLSGSAKGYGPPRLPAGLQVITDVWQLGTQTIQVLDKGEEELDAAFFRALGDTLGSTTGFPSLATKEIVEAFGQVMDGEAPTAIFGGLRPSK